MRSGDILQLPSAELDEDVLEDECELDELENEDELEDVEGGDELDDTDSEKYKLLM